MLPSYFKKRFGSPRENALGVPPKKRTDAWAAQARKEVAQPTTRAFDNLKTDADRKHERLQACRRHLHGGTLVFRGRLHRVLVIGIAHVKPGGRALVGARCKGGSYDAECSANYTADVYTLLCANHRSLRKK